MANISDIADVLGGVKTEEWSNYRGDHITAFYENGYALDVAIGEGTFSESYGQFEVLVTEVSGRSLSRTILI